jgi:hypothetical protein
MKVPSFHQGVGSIIISSAPAPPASSASSTTALSAHAVLLLLHDSNLLWAHAIHVHILPKALSATGTRWRLKLALRMRRLASKTARSAETWSARLRRAAAHHRHELVHVHLARVHALRHHLHHLAHVGHAGRRWAGHSWHTSAAAATAASIGIHAAHAEHGFHLHVLVPLLRDRAGHALLAHAVLRPGVLVEAVVEEVGLVGAGQAPEFGVLGEVGIDVEQGDGLVGAWPVGVCGEVDGAGAHLRVVFAFFAVVGGGAFEGCWCCCCCCCCCAGCGCCCRVFDLDRFGGRGGVG